MKDIGKLLLIVAIIGVGLYQVVLTPSQQSAIQQQLKPLQFAASALPTAAITAQTILVKSRIVIQTQLPVVPEPSVIIIQQSTPVPRECVLTTWPDGSQSCDDGTHISNEQSQPGYCVVVVWDTGQYGCNDGKPAGKVVLPSVATPPPPDDAEPRGAWSYEGSCVTATRPEGTSQTLCRGDGAPLSEWDAKYMARRIELGEVPAEQKGVPRG